jgi:uncharacterized protein
VWVALAVIVGAFALGAMLNARSLAATASALSPGAVRSVAVPLADGIARVSECLRLDRPHAWIEGIVHPDRPDGTVGPRPIFLPSPNRPASLLVAGDSLVDPFGPEMVRVASATGVITGRWEIQYSSGLTRPQLFDWADWFGEELAASAADIVVFMVGANDSQPIETPTGWASSGTPEWVAEYERRVDAMMILLTSRVATVYWVGQPIARSAEHSDRMAVLNEIYETVADDHERVRFVDGWDIFTDAGGRYADFLPGPAGRLVLMRQPDGIHLTPEGGERLARAVLEAVGLDWHIGP